VVWSVDLATGALGLTWINPNGSTPPLALFIPSNALYVGGDSAAFLAKCPAQ
jgi:hypothetical protein